MFQYLKHLINAYPYRTAAYSFLAGAIVGTAITGKICENSRSHIPQDRQVRTGFVNPSDLEISVINPDTGTKPLTDVKVKDSHYLFEYDQNNNPALVPYKVVDGKILRLNPEELKELKYRGGK